jgi:hypothetical protein
MHKGNLDIKSIVDSTNERLSLPVIVICPSPRIAHSMFIETQKRDSTDIVEFISQPCGARKLAKAFEICSERQRRQQSLADVKGDLLVIPADNSRPPGPNVRSENPHRQPEYQTKPDHSQAQLTALNEDDDDHMPQSQKTSATKILIVDDNAINVRVLVEFMKKMGCNYETASNGLEALNFYKANASSIAMILMGKLK